MLAERPDYTTEEYEPEAQPLTPLGGQSSGGIGGGASDSPSAEEEEEELDGAAVLKFVNEWLGSIADATVGLLLGQVVLVPELTTAGCAQLITDLEYLRYCAVTLQRCIYTIYVHVGITYEPLLVSTSRQFLLALYSTMH